MSQEKAVEKLGMNQNAISRLENPYYGKATLTTLKRIASAYDVGLLVEFVPFSRLIDRASGTPHLDPGLNPSTMQVPNFEAELPELERGPADQAVQLSMAEWNEISGSPSLPGGAIDVGSTAAPSASGAICANLPVMSTGLGSHSLQEPHTPRAVIRQNLDRTPRRVLGRRGYLYPMPSKRTGRRR